MFWVAAISAGRSLERQQPIFYFRPYQTVFYFHNQPTNQLTNQPTNLLTNQLTLNRVPPVVKHVTQKYNIFVLQVFESINLQPYDLSVDLLDVHAVSHILIS